jgi:DNA repair protein RadA/Sms
MRALRLTRLAAENNAHAFSDELLLLTETNLDIILEHVQALKPDLLIVDSIQTVYLPDMSSTAGSVSQVRECANRLRELAKTSGMAVFLVGTSPRKASSPARACSSTSSIPSFTLKETASSPTACCAQ